MNGSRSSGATAGSLPEALRPVAAGIRLLVLDVDGVLTDGRLYFDAEGREFKSFHVRDGYGLRRLMDAGCAVAVISGRGSAATEARLAGLGIRHALLNRDDKAAALDELLAALRVTADSVAAMGDDAPDLPVFRRVALALAPADAHPCVLETAHWRSGLGGGRGAVREACDLLLAHRPSP